MVPILCHHRFVFDHKLTFIIPTSTFASSSFRNPVVRDAAKSLKVVDFDVNNSQKVSRNAKYDLGVTCS